MNPWTYQIIGIRALYGQLMVQMLHNRHKIDAKWQKCSKNKNQDTISSF
jgi:hypothetical protein